MLIRSSYWDKETDDEGLRFPPPPPPPPPRHSKDEFRVSNADWIALPSGWPSRPIVSGGANQVRSRAAGLLGEEDSERERENETLGIGPKWRMFCIGDCGGCSADRTSSTSSDWPIRPARSRRSFVRLAEFRKAPPLAKRGCRPHKRHAPRNAIRRIFGADQRPEYRRLRLRPASARPRPVDCSLSPCAH